MNNHALFNAERSEFFRNRAYILFFRFYSRDFARFYLVDDKIIGVLFVAIVICVVIGLTNNGFKVDFNSLGGSYIESKRYEYGEKVEVENPTREGYEFDYWALDENCNIRANLDTMIVDSDFTLYACWLKK